MKYIKTIKELEEIVEEAKRRNIKLNFCIGMGYELGIYSEPEDNDDSTIEFDYVWDGGSFNFIEILLTEKYKMIHDEM